MLGRILILPKVGFDNAMKQIGIDDSNVDTVYHSFAFISIGNSQRVAGSGKQHNQFNPSFEENHWFKSDHENVLNLVFDDIGPTLKEQEPSLVLFDESMAKAIIKFWEKNKGKKFILHCTAGISRSGAVGNFIRQVENLNYESFKTDNPQILPNMWVLDVLSKVYGGQD